MKEVVKFQKLKTALWIITAVFTIAANTALAEMSTPDHPEWAATLKAKGTPITVYTAKKIYTMDPGRPEANAVAVLDGKVLSTGTLESMKPWLSRYKYTLNDTLKDKVDPARVHRAARALLDVGGFHGADLHRTDPHARAQRNAPGRADPC